MFNLLHDHKIGFFALTCALLICSVSTTLAFNNNVSDSISIVFTVMLTAVLFGLVLALLWEKIEDICNP